MVKLDSNTVESILNVNLLNKIGEPYNEYPNISNVNKVSKAVKSIKWENICLEEIGNLTGFLAVNHPDKYNLFWNQLVEEIKVKLIPHVESQLNVLLQNGAITKNIVDSVLFDIINIVMTFSYSEFFNSDFYTEMYKIYMDGHLPCGWKGKYPQGQIEIY